MDGVEKKIVELRNEMAIVAGHTGNLSDPRVVAIRQELDKFILLAQKVLHVPCIWE